MSGVIDVGALEEWIGKRIDSPFERLLGIAIVAVEPGNVVLAATPSEAHYNLMSRVHGGFCATLIDSAMGCAVMSSLRPVKPFGTVQLNIHYVHKIDIDSGQLLCRATVLHGGKTMLTVEAKVHDQKGKLYAHGTGTFLIYPG